MPAALALGGLLLAPTSAVRAVGGVVNLRCGDVTGLVRAMVAPPPAEVINLNTDGVRGCVYALTTAAFAGIQGTDGLPPVSTAITIRGNGAAIVRSATQNFLFRIIEVTSAGALSLIDATVAGGSPAPCDIGDNDCGGGIWNAGVLSLTGVTLSGNESSGLRNDGTASLTDSTVRGNDSSIGGGIYNGFGQLLLVRSTVSGNTAGFEGGGIFNLNTLSAVDSVVSDNTATNFSSGLVPTAFGGGLSLAAASTTILSATTVSDNVANGTASVGGGIYNQDGALTIIDGTVSGNSAISGSGPSPATGGGGIYNERPFDGTSGHVLLLGGAVRDNRAGNGGGISNGGSRTSVVTAGTAFSGNSPNNCAPSGGVVGCRG